MKTTTYTILFVLFLSGTVVSKTYSQKISTLEVTVPLLQPEPKVMEYAGLAVVYRNTPVKLHILCEGDESVKAGNYLIKTLKASYPGKFELYVTDDQNVIAGEFHIRIVRSGSGSDPEEQHYRIKSDKSRVTISSSGIMGMLYGVVTLSGLIQVAEGRVVIPFYSIEDWPSFSRRIFPSIVEPEDVSSLLDFALRNKIETIALAHRVYPWYEVDDRLEGIFFEMKRWKDKYGGPHIMAMHNIYDQQQMEISGEEDIDRLFTVIEAGINSGVNKLMILADDTPPFVFGEGYVLPHESDRERFEHMAEAHCYLMERIKKRFGRREDLIEIQYGPAFYTYEDMHYGDMSQYDGTPWEQQAYGPLKRDLAYLGRHLPEDVLIIWTGPNVRTRVLTEADIRDWTNYLGGKLPFLWDNTIYSHHPFTSSALFTAYDNQFPEDLYEISGGNGMAVNGNINAEEMKAGMITANDYLWDPAGYDKDKSLFTAMTRRYGGELTGPLFEFRDTELELRKKIGQRALWFEADTLWKIIRNTRWITEKNPLYYHLNYNGLKAMRMQLKYSVPQPQEISVFLSECRKLDERRRELLDRIKLVDPGLASDLEGVLVSLPGE